MIFFVSFVDESETIFFFIAFLPLWWDIMFRIEEVGEKNKDNQSVLFKKAVSGQ